MPRRVSSSEAHFIQGIRDFSTLAGLESRVSLPVGEVGRPIRRARLEYLLSRGSSSEDLQRRAESRTLTALAPRVARADIMLTVQGIPAFEDNYIWLIRRPARPEIAIVDPGDAAPVLAAIRAQGLLPVAILITHHHWDHTGGIADLLAAHPVPVIGPRRENIPQLTKTVGGGDQVRLPELDADFQVLDVPGHTAGHIAYYTDNPGGHGLLFIGDTLFAGGCGRLFEGTPAQMQASLSRVRALPDATQVYCAHEYTEANLRFARIAEPGNDALRLRQQEVTAQRRQGLPTVPSRLGLEKATNPFLRFDEPSIIRAAEGFAGKRLADPAEVFGTVRHWKDTLD
jgi:hydroxyacylglutathione hydrolase